MMTRITAVPSLRLLVVLVATVMFSPAAKAQEIIGVYLTWRQDPTTTMTINWVDMFTTGGNTVWHRQRGGEEWTSAQAKKSLVGETTMQVRRVELTGLKPDTMYEFVIGEKVESATSYHRFRTMPAKLERKITFVTGGDMMHSRAMVDAMNAQAAKLDPDFALLGGDLAYANGVSALRWIDWLQSWTKLCVGKDRRLIPMVLAIGNHEVRSKAPSNRPEDRAPFFYTLFSLPDGRSYYALDFADYLSLIILDSNHTQPVAGPQTDWLAQAMAQRTEKTFLFTCYHYPAYGTTKAPRGKLPIDAGGSVNIRKNWVPLFEKYGISASFENDHHNFKRSHRLRNHERDDENGILYLGDGAWGVKTRTVPTKEEGWWLAKAEPRNHLWFVEMNPKGTATIQAVDDKGKVFDEVELKEPRTKPVK